MRICSDQPCIVLLTEKDVWIRVNGKEPISLKANHMALLNCENNIIDVSSLNNTLVAHISHDIIKDYLRFLNKDLSQIPVWQRSATPILTLPCLTPDVFPGGTNPNFENIECTNHIHTLGLPFSEVERNDLATVPLTRLYALRTAFMTGSQ